jgi:hypothetical protein
MTYGIKVLRKLQLGRETTAGTAVPATTVWRGMGVLEDQRDHVFVEENIGVMGGVDRSYQPKLLGALSLESVPATFEQLPYLFEMGIAAQGTGVADSTGSGLVYTYVAPTTAVNTPAYYTIEGGDNTEAEEMEYCFAEKITIEGKAGEALMMSADVKGRQVAVSTFTTAGAAPLPSVEEILFSKGVMFLDAVSGTIGLTPCSKTLLDMSLEINTGLVPVWTADGALYYSFVKSTGPEILLALTFEHDATGQAAKVDWRANTPRLIRLTFSGSTLGTAGVYTYKTLQFDLAGKWDKIDPLGDQDGNDVVKGTFRARYNATAAKFFQAVVVNLSATLP